MVRAGLRRLLEHIDGIEVVLETDDGRSLLETAQKRPLDLAFMDIPLPGFDGFSALCHLKQLRAPPRTAVVSAHDTTEFVARALRAGADGFVSKRADPAELSQAVDALLQGQTYLSAGISAAEVDHRLARGPLQVDPWEQLTNRQRQVLRLIGEGYGTRSIAEALSVSPKTIETHRAALMHRLEARDVAGLVRWAFRLGLATP